MDIETKKPSEANFFAYFSFFFGLLGPIGGIALLIFWIVVRSGNEFALPGGLFFFGLYYLIWKFLGIGILIVGVIGLIFANSAKKIAQRENFDNPMVSSARSLAYINMILFVFYYMFFFTAFH